MEFLGFASLFLSGVWFVLSNYVVSDREFKRKTEERITGLEKSTGDACQLKHIKLKEDILNTVQGG
jgi:hypothetical protein